jgi:hypothetical protein
MTAMLAPKGLAISRALSNAFSVQFIDVKTTKTDNSESGLIDGGSASVTRMLMSFSEPVVVDIFMRSDSSIRCGA